MAKTVVAQFKEDKVSLEATSNSGKEAFANFAYYNALADAIQVVY